MVERALSIQRKYHGMNRNADDKAVQAAFITGMALISAHVAMKATNDSLFLSFFAVSSLPVMLMISSLIAMAAVHRASRLLVRLGPGKVVPGAFVISAILLSFAWLIMKWSPRAAAVLLFLHVSAVGSILISGFWSMINERFDPHTAKKKIGTIGLGGGIGGVLGGLVAGGVAAGFGQAPMFSFSPRLTSSADGPFEDCALRTTRPQLRSHHRHRNLPFVYSRATGSYVTSDCWCFLSPSPACFSSMYSKHTPCSHSKKARR